MRNPRRISINNNNNNNNNNKSNNSVNDSIHTSTSMFRWPRPPAFFQMGGRSNRLSPSSSRSVGKQDDADCPILLSVRPKLGVMDSCDSGFDSTSSRASVSPQPRKGLNSSILRRIFHRSTTMLFNVDHNCHESESKSTRRRRVQHRMMTTSDREVSDSSSSLNNSELHHHLEHDNSDLHLNSSLLGHARDSPKTFHSSCNSMLSSSADSGQYSGPEYPPGSEQLAQRPLAQSKWTSRDLLHAHHLPLKAPALVKAVLEPEESSKNVESVDATHILKCLSAAAAPSGCISRRSSGPDVSITVGMDTRLMLSRGRARPALGTAALAKATPTKPLRHTSNESCRSKISTVYLGSKSEQRVQVNSLLGKTPHCNSRYCTEKITVNGQHPCEFALRTPEISKSRAEIIRVGQGAIHV